jgi:phosphoadenosine phosphosulfate reductase
MHPNMNPDLADDKLRSRRHAKARPRCRCCARSPRLQPRHLANSLGAEDMVLTDLVMQEKLPIEIFSLDTGRLPARPTT